MPRRRALPITPDGASTASTRRPARRAEVPEGWQPRITDEPTLIDALERLPDQPGVYIMRDRAGHVVYVGKGARLRARVRQYFNGTDTRVFVPRLVEIVGDIETVITANVKEALLLENNLIKQHRPRFNVKLRDDSNYLVLRLDPNAKWPRLELVRQIKHDGAQYFGPYHSASSARSTLRVVNRHFQLRTCTDWALEHRRRPCLQHQIGRCGAPCVYQIDIEGYGDQVRDVALFLGGRHRELLGGLRDRMQRSAEGLEFEVASRLRDQLQAIETTLQRQQIVGTADVDHDAIGIYREGGQVEFVVLRVRQGKLLGSQAYSEKGLEHPDPEVLANFVSAYYDGVPDLPDEILLPTALPEDDDAPLQAWLRERRGRKVALAVPERGDRRKLVEMAQRNAQASFVARRNRQEDTEASLSRLQARLGLSKLPRTIECYDVSHIQGVETVASMVVFVDGVPDKSRYRSFRIKGLAAAGANESGGLAQGAFQNDDFASMYEVLGRRFRHAMNHDDEDAWALPDLVVIDGGKGQLGRAMAALDDLGVPRGAEGLDVVALAKERRGRPGRGRAALEEIRARRSRDGEPATAEAPGRAYEDYVLADSPAGEIASAETGLADDESTSEPRDADDAPDEMDLWEVRPERVFVPGVKDPLVLRPGSSERYLMERIRDEAHRFAIGHHRKRRGKRALHSVLDDIEGVGPALKRALVKHFGSVGAIKTADAAALAAVPGIGPKLAERIAQTLRGR